MKRVLMVLLAVGMATAWVGCQKEKPATPASPTNESTSSSGSGSTVTADTKLVTLNVPNMT